MATPGGHDMALDLRMQRRQRRDGRACSGASAATVAPTWSARVDRLRSTPSRA